MLQENSPPEVFLRPQVDSLVLVFLANVDLDSFHHCAPRDQSAGGGNSNDVADLPLQIEPALLPDFEDVHPYDETGHHKVESWEVILASDHEGLANLPRSSFMMMIAKSSWLAHYATLLDILLHQISTSHHHPVSLIAILLTVKQFALDWYTTVSTRGLTVRT